MWPCFLRSFLSLLPLFLFFLAFLASFRVFHNLLIILRGWVLSWIHTNNTIVFSSLSHMRIFIFTPISLIVHLSLLLSSPPSSFLPPFFSFFPLFSSLFFFSLSMQIFGAATAAMPPLPTGLYMHLMVNCPRNSKIKSQVGQAVLVRLLYFDCYILSEYFDCSVHNRLPKVQIFNAIFEFHGQFALRCATLLKKKKKKVFISLR